MYFGINDWGVKNVVDDDAWKEYYKSEAVALYYI